MTIKESSPVHQRKLTDASKKAPRCIKESSPMHQRKLPGDASKTGDLVATPGQFGCSLTLGSTLGGGL